MQDKFMRRALQLARQGWGMTSPNPMVGAVVVSDGEIVGQGYHRRAGEPHAEIAALRDAADRAAGADLYVNLEPCSHQGRTPPCADEIIRRRVRRVFAAMSDPNPQVKGEGFSRLRRAGVEVHEGLLRAEARRLNEAYVKFISTGSPFVLLKMAMTLDGKIATRTGDSRWVSGSEAREWVHHMRGGYDAVMVGIGTVLADDPRLDCRLQDVYEEQQPLRAVMDSSGRLPSDCRMLEDAHSNPVLLATTRDAPQRRLERLLASGVQVEIMPSSSGGVDAAAFLRLLGRRDVTSVLVEGGGELAWSLLSGGLVDKVVVFVSAKMVGGRDAPTGVRGAGVDKMSQALVLDKLEVEKFGDDVRITGYIPT